MEALEILIQQGKIRYAGVSNYNVNQVKEARKTIDIISNQVAYSMLNRGIEKDLVPFAIDNNVGIIAYSPMERGLLTGKYFKDGKLKDNDHRNGYFKQFDLPKVEAFLNKIKPLASDKGVTLSQLVLRWTSLQPAISIVLAGARNAEQAIENANAMKITLTTDEIKFINMELDKM